MSHFRSEYCCQWIFYILCLLTSVLHKIETHCFYRCLWVHFSYSNFKWFQAASSTTNQLTSKTHEFQIIRKQSSKTSSYICPPAEKYNLFYKLIKKQRFIKFRQSSSSFDLFSTLPSDFRTWNSCNVNFKWWNIKSANDNSNEVQLWRSNLCSVRHRLCVYDDCYQEWIEFYLGVDQKLF